MSVLIINFMPFSLQIFQKWLISNEGQSSISSIDSYALDGSATKHLIVGRQDGCIEVYQVFMQDDLDKPKQIFKYVSFSFNNLEERTIL